MIEADDRQDDFAETLRDHLDDFWAGLNEEEHHLLNNRNQPTVHARNPTNIAAAFENPKPNP